MKYGFVFPRADVFEAIRFAKAAEKAKIWMNKFV